MSVPGPRSEAVVEAETIRFGAFELNTRAGELRKHGIRIKLKQQAFLVLHMLLKQPGQVVLREEIREKLWPNDTVVEFDHSINAAIQKLRDALGESAADPRYIETLPRRGYRFIGTVEPAPLAAEPMMAPGLAPGVRFFSKRTPLLASALAVLTGVIVIAAARLSPREDHLPVSNWTFSLGSVGSAAVSPDGSAVVYRSPQRGLILRRMNSLEEIPAITEARLGDNPVWSPDSSQLLFRTMPDLTRLPLPNGPPTVLWPQTGVTRGYAFALDGSVLVSVLGRPDGGGLWRIPPGGGNPTHVEVPGFADGVFFHPEFLPDGKNVLFGWEASTDTSIEVGLYLATIEGGKIARGPFLLRKSLTTGRYSPAGGGKLLYLQNDNLYVQNLNAGRGRLEGAPEKVVEGVFSDVRTHYPGFSVSRNGVLVWRAGRAGLAQLTWFDRGGKVLDEAGPPGLPDAVRLSPDEKHVLVYTVADGGGWAIVEPNQSGYAALPGVDDPLWMPDSSHIFYARREGNTFRLVARAAGGGVEKELARVPRVAPLHDISPDGKVLLYKVESTLNAVRLDGSPESAKPQLVVTQSTEGRLSPDGRWVVYAQTVNDRTDVYVKPFPSGGLSTQITSKLDDTAPSPIWRGDGKEILYRSGSTIYSVRVEVRGNAIRAEAPEALFKVRVPAGIVGDSMPLAVTHDGSRILFAQGVDQPDPQLTYVMTAWDSRLRQ